jgi:hypothetical protein
MSLAQYATAGSPRADAASASAGGSPTVPRTTTLGTRGYSVDQPHQSGICSVCGGAQPSGRRSAVRKRIGANSRPDVQRARMWRPTSDGVAPGRTGSLDDSR